MPRIEIILFGKKGEDINRLPRLLVDWKSPKKEAYFIDANKVEKLKKIRIRYVEDDWFTWSRKNGLNPIFREITEEELKEILKPPIWKRIFR